ncbi:unnamed protein product [Protopolystoma xenopodis]|uniref:Uncharacterized protein n=1 Tax=Protopolystoma xenopodis TaxID=117903 RepID=A0A448X719_9PLAT|nr:unnamed protein product [Protopolystoma xenopodis]
MNFTSKYSRYRHGDSGNLLDSLLNRMEKYTKAMEDQVKQRTNQYTDEKHRVERLLETMLPK